MDWQKAISTLLITILFVPLVFMGANVFFPKYDSNYKEKPCAMMPSPEGMTAEETKELNIENQKCWEKNQEEMQKWEENKRKYDSYKYIFIGIVSLLALISTLIIQLNHSIRWGLFIGSTITAFLSTLIYFRTKSRMGFLILLILFVTVIIFINKKIKKNT